MSFSQWSKQLLKCLVLLCTLQWVTAGTVSLPSYPLAVKSPYLSAWLPGNLSYNAPTAQAQFWTGKTNLTWQVLARFNDQTYTLFGAPNGIPNSIPATQVGPVEVSSSHTLFFLEAGSISFTLDFFSPVLPDSSDYARQSLPYSYLTVLATQLRLGPPTTIQILSAIDQSWTGQNGTAGVNYTEYDSTGLFWFNNPSATEFTEVMNMASYGSVIYATTQSKGSVHGCASATTIYSSFTSNGSLPTGPCQNNNLVALSDTVETNSLQPYTTFAVGVDRSDAIQYLNSTTYTGYYRSEWPTPPMAVDYFLKEFPILEATSTVIDAKILNYAQRQSKTYGSNYSDIIEASVRQVFACFEITIPLSTMDTSAPYAFLKEISSDGNVNTMDLQFRSFPIFVNFNPDFIKLLLRPILDYLNVPVNKGGWPKNFMIHDIGSHYPNATGHANGIEEDMPLFESSALFILLDTYQKYSNDSSFIAPYRERLNSFASYLVGNALYPLAQLISADTITATANQTGLAIQSAIGLKAAGRVLGNDTYSAAGDSYATQIYEGGLGLNTGNVATSTHFTWNFGKKNSWGTVFSAFADVLLDLNTFPSAAWDMQTAWYTAQLQPAGFPFFGPQNFSMTLGGLCDWGLVDFSFWVSAASQNSTFTNSIVTAVHAFLTNGMNTEPFGSKYVVEAPGIPGQWLSNRAKSTVGSNFALLAVSEGYWGSLYEDTFGKKPNPGPGGTHGPPGKGPCNVEAATLRTRWPSGRIL